jgi:hypothetical protein
VHCLRAWALLARYWYCSLAIGSADVDKLEDTLERGDKLFLSSKDAVEACTVLAMGVCYSFLGFASESCLTHWTFVPAISFFDRAKGSAFTKSPETLLVDILPLVCNFFPFFSVFSSVFFFWGVACGNPPFSQISPQMKMLAKLCMHA